MVELFGDKWAFQYSEDDWVDKNGISQVEKYNYKRIKYMENTVKINRRLLDNKLNKNNIKFSEECLKKLRDDINSSPVKFNHQNLAKVSCKIENAKVDKGQLYVDMVPLSTPYGNIIKEVINNQNIEFRLEPELIIEKDENGVVKKANLISVDILPKDKVND